MDLMKSNLNVLPLWSYNALIGMDWLEKHRAKVHCYGKVLECIGEEGRPRLVRGTPNQVLVRQILALQLRKVFNYMQLIY